MTEPENAEPPEAITAWHPMLVALLEIFLPSGWLLIPELLLSRLPQRVDIVILELVGAVRGSVSQLHSIFDYLRPHTLIEHKGPTDDLAGEDALVLVAYGMQYMRLKKIKDPGAVCLMVVADQVTQGFVDQVTRHGGRFARGGRGLWEGEVAGFALHGVETKDAARAGSSERLLYAFSRAFLQDPRGGPPLDDEARRVYSLLQAQVEQFRKARGPAAMKYEELMQMSMDELLDPVLESMSLKRRLRGLQPEEVVKELAKALGPEKLAEALDGLPPEQLEELQEQIKRRLH